MVEEQRVGNVGSSSSGGSGGRQCTGQYGTGGRLLFSRSGIPSTRLEPQPHQANAELQLWAGPFNALPGQYCLLQHNKTTNEVKHAKIQSNIN